MVTEIPPNCRFFFFNMFGKKRRRRSLPQPNWSHTTPTTTSYVSSDMFDDFVSQDDAFTDARNVIQHPQSRTHARRVRRARWARREWRRGDSSRRNSKLSGETVRCQSAEGRVEKKFETEIRSTLRQRFVRTFQLRTFRNFSIENL